MFEEITKGDLASWNVTIVDYGKLGNMGTTHKLFENKFLHEIMFHAIHLLWDMNKIFSVKKH